MQQPKNMCYEWERLEPNDFGIFKYFNFTEEGLILYGPTQIILRELLEQKLTKHVPANICPYSINSSAHYACLLRELGETTDMCSKLPWLIYSFDLHQFITTLSAIVLLGMLIYISMVACSKLVTISEEIKNPMNVNGIDVDKEDDKERNVIIYKSEQLLQSSRTILNSPWSRLSRWMRPLLRPYTHWQIHAHFVELNRSYTFELRRGEENLNCTDRSEGMPLPSRCVKLGKCKISSKKLVEIAKSHKFNGQEYNVRDCNCQLWCQEFCSKISSGLEIKCMWDLGTVFDNVLFHPISLVIIRGVFCFYSILLPLDGSMLLDRECLTMISSFLGTPSRYELINDEWFHDLILFCLYVYSLLGFVVNTKILCFHNIVSSVGSGVIIFSYFYWSFSVSLLISCIVLFSFGLIILEIIFYICMGDHEDCVDFYDIFLSVHIGYPLNEDYLMFFRILILLYLFYYASIMVRVTKDPLNFHIGHIYVCCKLFSEF